MSSTIPTTATVLKFLVKSLGLTIRKDAGLHHEKVRRLAKRCQQKKNRSRQVEDALIDAVAKLFASSSEATKISGALREMPFQNRIHHVFRELHEPNAGELEFTMLLIFTIVYFIEHHEWLCPQLELKHRLDDGPDDALWDWIEHAWHFYTIQLLDLANANGHLFKGLPNNLRWNLPAENRDNRMGWPVSRMIDWWVGLLAKGELEKLPGVLFPKSGKEIAKDATRRLKHPHHPPNLNVINLWAKHSWQYAAPGKQLGGQKLKIALLWCRVLQTALRTVERRFGTDSVNLLLEFYRGAAGDVQIDSRTSSR